MTQGFDSISFHPRNLRQSGLQSMLYSFIPVDDMPGLLNELVALN